MMRGIQKLAELDGKAILGGGAAGLGAYALANTLTKSTAEAQRIAMEKAIESYARTKATPLVAGAITALLVGAFVASRMKNKAQQPTMTPQQMMYQRQGFLPGEAVPFPAGHAMYR